MNQFERLREIITTYERHGWHLERVLLRPETRALFDAAMISEPNVSFAEAIVRESTVDAMWFKREAAQTGREAWELRLVADTPYALFETFEADEAEEDREDVRREMEALLLEKMRPAAPPPNYSS
jgi:hypothetical protein